MRDEPLLALAADIYDAATDDARWAAVGQGLTRLVGAQSASLMVGDPNGGPTELLYHGDIPLEAVAAYRQRYSALDLWTNRAAAALAREGPDARPKVWTSGTLVPDDEFLRSEFYGEFGRRLGLRYVVGTVLPLGDAGTMPIGLHRPADARPFERAEAQLLEQLLPHLRRAMQLRHRLRSATSSAPPSLAALDALASGVLVVDADLRVLVSNVAAEGMAAPGGPIRFVGAGGGGRSPSTTLRALRHADTAALTRVVRATALLGAPGGAVPLRDVDGVTAAAALVSPLPRRLADGEPGLAGRVGGRAMILIRSIGRQPAPLRPEILRDLFGLSPAEADVARALAGGATKETVAQSRNARPSTVRTQVRSLLAKTGARNLRDLERLLATLIAL